MVPTSDKLLKSNWIIQALQVGAFKLVAMLPCLIYARKPITPAMQHDNNIVKLSCVISSTRVNVWL